MENQFSKKTIANASEGERTVIQYYSNRIPSLILSGMTVVDVDVVTKEEIDVKYIERDGSPCDGCHTLLLKRDESYYLVRFDDKWEEVVISEVSYFYEE